jgi:hypothetical protein
MRLPALAAPPRRWQEWGDPTLHPGLCGCGRRDSTRRDVNARRDASAGRAASNEGLTQAFHPYRGTPAARARRRFVDNYDHQG